VVFEAAGIEVALWIPPVVAFVISFFTCMGGVSGAFLLLPFQMSVLGYTAPSVSATNQLFNVVAIPSGVYRYWREGRMVWPLTWAVVIGTLPGVMAGAWIRVTWLPDARNFKLFAAVVLGYIGMRMATNLLRERGEGSGGGGAGGMFPESLQAYGGRAGGDDGHPPMTERAVQATRVSWRRVSYSFLGETQEAGLPGIALLSLTVGVVGGIYGIGGGSIIAPFLVSFYGLPVYTVAGPALMGTFMTSLAGVGFYQALAPFRPGMSVAPDWLLGVLFGLGGMVGMYLGARLQKRVPARAIKWMLAVILVFTAGRYTLDFFG
jgi:uncharacterized membrane protein YfcA